MARPAVVTALAIAVFAAVMAASATYGAVEPFQAAAAISKLLQQECSSLGPNASAATKELCAGVLGKGLVSGGSGSDSGYGYGSGSRLGVTPRSIRADACTRLRMDAPIELQRACRMNDFGSTQQSRDVSLDSVAACVDPCEPKNTCGKVTTTCSAPASVSALRCDITSTALKTREGDSVSGPHSAPYRVFVVATPACLRSNDFGGFKDDAGAIRIMMTFPEKILLGDTAILSVALPQSWGVTLSGRGDGDFLIPPEYRVPPQIAARFGERVPAMSVFRSSRAHQENGFRVTSVSALANRLHIGSSREPASESKTARKSDAMFSVQPIELAFTMVCREGGAGLGAIAIKVLGPGERQLGRSVDKVELRAGATAMPVTVESPASERTVKWEVGRDVKSPVSGRSVGILKIAWVCLSVDTWTGRITDCREVLIGEKGTSVSRTRNTEIVVDLSADLPVNVLGLGGLALGIGRAEENIFGGGDVSQMSLVA